MTTSQLTLADLHYKMSPEKWAMLRRWATATNAATPIKPVASVKLGTVNARINCQLVIETCATPGDQRLLIYESRELVWTGRFTQKGGKWALLSDDGKDWSYKIPLSDISSLEDFGQLYFAAQRRQPLPVTTAQTAFAFA